MPWSAAFNKVSQEHVDFLLCDRENFGVAAAIELDGSSHWRRDRRDSDEFKDELFQTLGVPLIRFPVRRYFDPVEVSRRIREVVAP